MALRFSVPGEYFENKAFRKRWRHDNHVISLPEFSSETTPICPAIGAFLYSSAVVWTNKQIDVSFLCVCPVLDHEFRHNIVKASCGSPSGSVDYFENVMTKFIVNNRTNPLKTDIDLFFTITDCRISRSRLLMRRTNFKFMCRSAYWI